MMELVEAHESFGGCQQVWRTKSLTLDCDTTIGVYTPPLAKIGQKCPVVFWLSGLTCTEQNFITKAGAQKAASELGLIIVAPDTSPRGEHVPNDDAYDMGQGAGFYLNATQEPWVRNYRMYDYIVNELPALVESHFDAASAVRCVSGHSMGGHGALMIALKNPGLFRSASAFSPIVAPSKVPWGQKAFTSYLGDDLSLWAEYDTVELIRAGLNPSLPMLIDQGLKDNFLEEQLQTQRLAEVVGDRPIEIRMQEGYDHSYYFIASFIEDHLKWHAEQMKKPQA